MKKLAKLLCLMMVLVLALTLFSGCISTGESKDEDSVLDMTIGIPVGVNDPEFADWQPVISYWKEDLGMFYNMNVSFVTVPSDEAGMKDFMKKVKNGTVAFFYADQSAFTDQMIEDEALVSLSDIRAKYTGFMEERSPAIYNISAEADRTNYMIPLAGDYQGLFVNTALFEQNALALPTDWASLQAAIAKFAELGITPIAAGFADQGLEYMVDEMILAEGGTAEHSYQPTFGIVSSWERAVADIKALEAIGAFTPDCYNVSFDSAKQAFLGGQAAMIVAPASQIVSDADAEATKVLSFPCTPTGKKEAGAFLGDIPTGIYISSGFFNKTNARYSDVIIEFLSTDYAFDAATLAMSMDADDFCAIDEYYDSESSALSDSVRDMVAKAKAADQPKRANAKAMDETVAAFRKALTGGDVSAAMLEATNAEIKAGENK
jgi:hypothetical protein